MSTVTAVPLQPTKRSYLIYLWLGIALALMAEGRSNAEIGATLVITDSAVSKHINSIFAKLGLYPGDAGHRRVLAVLRYLGAGPVSP